MMWPLWPAIWPVLLRHELTGERRLVLRIRAWNRYYYSDDPAELFEALEFFERVLFRKVGVR